jgi:hypothetical protein
MRLGFPLRCLQVSDRGVSLLEKMLQKDSDRAGYSAASA